MDKPPLIWRISLSISFVVVFLIVIEVLSVIYVKIAIRKGALQNAEEVAALPVYRSEPWGATYWRDEVDAFNVVYEPYVLWKRAPYQGETITIDEDGLRRTTHSECTAQNYTIWAFGGSTMWGQGSPDWLTIPSLLAEKYEKSGKSVCVKNYGTNAWVNTQEVIKLMLELKHAPRKPDLVIFYDGFNDTYSLYQSGMVDVPINNDLIKRKLEVGYPVQQAWNHAHFSELRLISHFLQQMKIGQIIIQLGAKLRKAQSGSRPAFSRQLDSEQIHAQLDSAYLKNMEVVGALAQQYGFKFVFFWQPVILVGHKQLSVEEEVALKKTLSDFGGIQTAFQEMYDLAQKQQDRPGFFDIADVLDKYKGTFYIDFAHLTPEGNSLVADRIFDVLHNHAM